MYGIVLSAQIYYRYLSTSVGYPEAFVELESGIPFHVDVEEYKVRLHLEHDFRCLVRTCHRMHLEVGLAQSYGKSLSKCLVIVYNENLRRSCVQLDVPPNGEHAGSAARWRKAHSISASSASIENGLDRK